MKVSDIQVLNNDESCELQATISCAAFKRPFVLWYRFPAEASRVITADSANPWVAALLLPAMWVGETLEISTPISPKLFRALNQIQAVYAAWLPALSTVEVKVPLRTTPPSIGEEVGLFFSSGVDSWYSLLKNQLDRRVHEDLITQLVVIHGADIDVGDSGKKNVFDMMLANTKTVAPNLAKEVLPVGTNVRLFYYKLGISWHWAQAGALASVGLAAEGVFKKFYVATWLTYAEVAHFPDVSSGGCHPLLDPLWSTESLAFVHDGCEATRLEKIRLLTEFPNVLDTLRVCWANDERQFNCGSCGKCLRTILALKITGGLEKCRTLPSIIKSDSLRKLTFLFPHEFVYFDELLDQLNESDADNEIRTALREAITKGKLYFSQLAVARQKISLFVPPEDPLILVDDETIRFQLAADRKIIPFLERDGDWFGRPPNDSTAICELERLRGAEAKFIVFWREAFWWLKYYSGFTRYLESTYSLTFESENLIIFDLRSTEAPTK